MYNTNVISAQQDLALKISTDNSTSIISKTIERIIKDFDNFGYSIKYSGTPEEAYDHILSQLKVIIEEMIINRYSNLLDLLCGIDLSEKRVKDFISINPHVAPSNIISKLIIEREFKKVCDCASYGSE